MFYYISKAFYGAAMNGAETGRINPTQAHELTGMVRLAMACGDLRCDKPTQGQGLRPVALLAHMGGVPDKNPRQDHFFIP